MISNTSFSLNTGSIENAGCPNGLPSWGTSKKPKSIKVIDNLGKVINNYANKQSKLAKITWVQS